MPVFELLDDAADCLVSKDKALFKTARWGPGYVAIPHALCQLCRTDGNEAHTEEHGNWLIAGSRAVLTVDPVQESGDATLITCDPGPNIILEATRPILETARLVETAA